MKKVHMLAGVEYLKADDEGLHIRQDRQVKILPVENIVVCAGQEPLRALWEPLRAAGIPAHLIGGANLATELDAKRAVKEGAELAARL